LRDHAAHRVVADSGVGEQHPQVAEGDREHPETHDHALHRFRRLAVGEFQSGGRHQHFAEGEQGIGQHLPGNRGGRATIDAELDHAAAIQAKPEKAMPQPMRRSAVTLKPSLRSEGIQHQVVERDQQHHQQRIERLHLRGLLHQPAWPPPGIVRHHHDVALQDPGRGFLVEQRPERRDDGKHDQDAQHRAHAIDCGVRMQAARALQLHRSADAAEQR
jgi:hypothetical protein